jgi:outer membrane protein assembly factor BamB
VKRSRPGSTEILQAGLKGLAAVSAVFGVVVAAFVLVTSIKLSSIDPLSSKTLADLKERVGDPGAGESLYAEIRDLDLLARQAYFSSRDRLNAGVALFLGAWGICLGALHIRRLMLKQKPPAAPRRMTAAEALESERSARLGVAVLGGVIAMACVGSLLFVPRGAWDMVGAQTAAAASDAQKTAVGDQAAATAPAVNPLSQWPCFRGPLAGIAAETPDPAWEGGKVAVLWKADIPLEGYGSPVVWESSVFLDAADDRRQLVIAFDAGAGNVKWNVDVAKAAGGVGKLPEISPDSSQATPTMACNADGVYALFATGRIVSLDFGGVIRWKSELGLPDNPNGIASSLAVYDAAANGGLEDGEGADTLIVQFDQTDKPALIALDTETGRRKWSAEREGNPSWSSPILVSTSGGPRLIVTGNPYVEAFDPSTGRSVWRIPLLGGDVVTSPAFFDDTVYVASQFAVAAAIPAGNPSGDRNTLWEFEDSLPNISSPLATKNGVYFCMTRGKLTSLDPKTGKQRWTADLRMEVNASPILVGNLVIIVSKNGTISAFEETPATASDVKPAWSIKIGEAVFATPAFIGGRMYLRTDRSLLCIGAEP